MKMPTVAELTSAAPILGDYIRIATCGTELFFAKSLVCDWDDMTTVNVYNNPRGEIVCVARDYTEDESFVMSRHNGSIPMGDFETYFNDHWVDEMFQEFSGSAHFSFGTKSELFEH